MSANDTPFAIFDRSTVTLAVTGTSAFIALGHQSPQNLTQTVRIAAPSTNTGAVFIRFGPDNTIVATVADVPILPGTVETFSIGPADDFIAGILATGTGVIYATCGSGQ